jgi:hypothetical protein
MSVKEPPNSQQPEAYECLENCLLEFIGQMLNLAVKERKSLVALLADLLRPYGIPPTPLHEVLHEAANRAGWTTASAKAQRRQQAAAQGRKTQREQDLAHRRILVMCIFKELRPGLRVKHGSLGTAQAIIGRLERLTIGRRPPMTVRTIQEDIRFMKENGNFGI